MPPESQPPGSSGRKSLLLAAGIAALALGSGWWVRGRPATLTAAPALPPEFSQMTPGLQVGDATLVALSWGLNGLIRVDLKRADGRQVALALVRGERGHWSLAAADGGDEALSRAFSQRLVAPSSETRAPATAVSAGPQPVIPPGQEALIAQMLGKDVDLPGGCRWEGASIERSTVGSEYRCGSEPRHLTLCHPRAACAENAAAITAQFALEGSLPPELLGAVSTRIREREGSFHWEEEAGPVFTGEGRPGSSARATPSP